MRLSYLPLIAVASIACHSTEPANHSALNGVVADAQSLVANASGQTPLQTEPARSNSSLAAPAANGVIAQSATTDALAEGIRVEGSLSTPTALPLQNGAIDEQAARIQRRREQSRHLSGQLVEDGAMLTNQADLTGALSSYSRALELDPGNDAARAGIRKVQALMGNNVDAAAEGIQDEADRIIVQRAQARLAVEEYAVSGDNALRAGDYQGAVDQYRHALNVLQVQPMISSEELDSTLMRERLNQATQLRDENLEEETRRAAEQADAARALREEEAETQRQNTIDQHFAEANQDFVSNRYDEAEVWTNLILAAEPGNESAHRLRTLIVKARFAHIDAMQREKLREEWLKTFDELRFEGVPQTEAIKYDLERWAKVSKRTPYSADDLESAIDPDREEILNILRSTRFEVRFGGVDGDGTALADVATYLQNLTGVNFYVSPTVVDSLGEEETNVTLSSPENSVENVLNLIDDLSDELTWKIEAGLVKFVTSDEATGGQITVTYPVHDLINPVRDYPGPEINVAPSGGIESNEEEAEPRESNVISGDQLEILIQGSIGGESWDNDAGNQIRVVAESGTMVVSQTPEVHAEIRNLLEDLREATGIMVDIQAQFVKVEDNFLEDIGVDFRGLGPPGLGVNGADFNDFGDPAAAAELTSDIGRDNSLGVYFDDGGDGNFRGRMENLYDRQLGTDEFRGSGGLSFQWTFLDDLQLQLVLRAVSKSERIELVTAPRLLVHNNSRAHLAVLNQIAYVQDFDVQIAQASSIADPVVRVTHEGVVLDVRPVVSADRRFVTMELRPTVARLKRPMNERATTLGSQTSVTIQLPEIEYQRVRTTIPIPDGGTVMLGGMKEIERQSYNSGVPILNKIPILSLLFDRKGNYVSNRKLLILLRADIVIPAEIEPTEAETQAYR